MPSGIAQRPADVVKQPLPELAEGPGQTRNSAIHPIRFIGRLTPWANFNQQVMETFGQHSWSSATLSHRPMGTARFYTIGQDFVRCGDENGVQGRFEQNVGQVMTAVFASQGINITFGDFKCSAASYRKIPDVAGTTWLGALRFVGELKVPWVWEHSLENALQDEDRLRDLLGQIAEYMKDNDLRYGFFSTYRETIFLRQYNYAPGRYELQYSPVMHHSAASGPAVSLRQCMWALGIWATEHTRAYNALPKSEWIKHLV